MRVFPHLMRPCKNNHHYGYLIEGIWLVYKTRSCLVVLQHSKIPEAAFSGHIADFIQEGFKAHRNDIERHQWRGNVHAKMLWTNTALENLSVMISSAKVPRDADNFGNEIYLVPPYTSGLLYLQVIYLMQSMVKSGWTRNLFDTTNLEEDLDETFGFSHLCSAVLRLDLQQSWMGPCNSSSLQMKWALPLLCI